jgi:hypothetical protein
MDVHRLPLVGEESSGEPRARWFQPRELRRSNPTHGTAGLAAQSFGNYRLGVNGESKMRAETQSVVEEIKQSVGLLRRAL